MKTYEEFKRERDSIRKKNEKLIAYWKSIPWWKFWIKKPSLEEQKRIIVKNWGF